MDFDQRLLHYYDKRDQAAASLKATAADVGDSLKSEVQRLTDGSTFEEIIVKHPFISTGVAIGAGVIATKLLVSGSPKAPSATPQRVVIEIQHSGAAVASTPPASTGFDPLGFVMKAVAGYEAVQNILRNFRAQRPPPADSASVPFENAPQ